jgi:hypothetical protein
MLDKCVLRGDRGGAEAGGWGGGHLPTVTNQHVSRCYTRPRTWRDSLPRRKQRKVEMIQYSFQYQESLMNGFS